MSTNTQSHHVVIDLSLAESWVVHHVLLDSIGLASGEDPSQTPPDWVVRILRKIEADDFDFSPLELDHVCHELSKYARAEETPTADRRLARQVIDRAEDLLEDADLDVPGEA